MSERDPILEQLVRERKPGEIESGMLTGSDAGEISATERFEGELSRREALAALDPGYRSEETVHVEEADDFEEPLGRSGLGREGLGRC